MQPFDTYPSEESKLRDPLRPTDNCRHGYGLDLQNRTGQTRCAYCGISLVDDYYHWLLLAVDHVVPASEGKRLGIPPEILEGLVNKVLVCSGCNGFSNRYAAVHETPRANWTLQEFIELRDRVFAERKLRIAERRAEEVAFFDGKPWKR